LDWIVLFRSDAGWFETCRSKQARSLSPSFRLGYRSGPGIAFLCGGSRSGSAEGDGLIS